MANGPSNSDSRLMKYVCLLAMIASQQCESPIQQTVTRSRLLLPSKAPIHHAQDALLHEGLSLTRPQEQLNFVIFGNNHFILHA